MVWQRFNRKRPHVIQEIARKICFVSSGDATRQAAADFLKGALVPPIVEVWLPISTNRSRLVSKKFCKIFQIYSHIKSLDTYMEY